MTSRDEQIIRSTLNTLVELVYRLMKKEDGLTNDAIELLKQNEQALLRILNEKLFQDELDENIYLNE